MYGNQFWWAQLLWFWRFQKWPNFPFEAWIIYSPWSSKNLIDRNWFKKFMQVGVDVTCMHTIFGGSSPSGFGDMATFQKRPNFPFGHGL